MNIAPSKNKFVHFYRKGHECWNLEVPGLEESSANARKDVIDCINSSMARRGQIAKCVRALR